MEQNSQFDRRKAELNLSCAEFDAMLADALDGVLSEASQRRFDSHRLQCPTCAPLFRETSAGMAWLDSLEELEPPVNLVHNILSATSLRTAPAAVALPKLGWKQRLSGVFNDLAVPIRGLVREPRLAMTAAMAIFSVILSLNLAGVHLADLRHLDLRPSAIRETATIKYTETTNRVIHYYNSIRVVYEFESRLQELKKATSNTEEQEQRRPSDRNKTENKNEKEREQNYYSMDRENMQLARWSNSELKQGSVQKPGTAAESISVGVNDNKENQVIARLHSGLQAGKSIGSLEA